MKKHMGATLMAIAIAVGFSAVGITQASAANLNGSVIGTKADIGNTNLEDQLGAQPWSSSVELPISAAVTSNLKNPLAVTEEAEVNAVTTWTNADTWTASSAPQHCYAADTADPAAKKALGFVAIVIAKHPAGSGVKIE